MPALSCPDVSRDAFSQEMKRERERDREQTKQPTREETRHTREHDECKDDGRRGTPLPVPSPASDTAPSGGGLAAEGRAHKERRRHGNGGINKPPREMYNVGAGGEYKREGKNRHNRCVKSPQAELLPLPKWPTPLACHVSEADAEGMEQLRRALGALALAEVGGK